MKRYIKLMTGVFIVALLQTAYLRADTHNEDSVRIQTIVESVGVYADNGNFEALEKLYADEIELDYRSLTGGEIALKSPGALMSEWASVLPGFDVTRHAVSNIAVKVKGNNAVATARVVADHYVDELFWQVEGSYRYELKKHENTWWITTHAFNLENEKGTRDVFGRAIENAKRSPVSYLTRQKTEQAVRIFLSALEEKDMQAFADVWADDAVQDMPYAPQGFPGRVEGKQALLRHYADWPKNSGEADFTSQLVFYPMQNPELVFVEFKGDVFIVPTERQYRQSYGGLFHVKDGKIKFFREYFNPEPFKYAFGL